MATLDETPTLLPDETHDAVLARIDALLQLVKAHYSPNPDEAMRLLDIVTALSQAAGYPLGLARADNQRGVTAVMHSRYQEALRYFELAHVQYEALGDKNGVIRTLSNIGGLYCDISAMTQGQEKNLAALRLAEELGNETIIATIASNIGSVYSGMKEYALALQYMERTLVLELKVGNHENASITLLIMGDIYRETGNYPLAYSFLRRGLRFLRRKDRNRYYGTGLVMMLRLCRKQKQWLPALRYGQAALVVFRRQGDQHNELIAALEVSLVYQGLGRYEESLVIAQDVLVIEPELNIPSLRRDAHRRLSDGYEALGDLGLSLHHLRESLRADEEHREREQQQRFQELQVQHETEMARREAEQERQKSMLLHALAYTDALTQLPNRRQMSEWIADALGGSGVTATDAQPMFTLVIGDIDYFKKINDRLGHDAGDSVLQQVAERLQQSVAESGIGQMGRGRVSRWGGEEFCLLFLATGSETAAASLRLFLQNLAAHPLMWNGNPERVSLTFGVAEYRLGDTADTLLRRADTALYDGKTGGRNRVVIARDSPNMVPTESKQ